MASTSAGRAVLFHTGWDRHWGTDAYGDAGHPYLAADAVEHLVAGGAAVVGIDSVNIDDTSDGRRPVHTACSAPASRSSSTSAASIACGATTFTFSAVPPASSGWERSRSGHWRRSPSAT